MNFKIQSTLMLLIIVGFFHSIKCEIVESSSEEDIITPECQPSGYALVDSCGSFCRCKKNGDLVSCEKRKCLHGERPYSPVEDYEIIMESYAGSMGPCEPNKPFNNGCNMCHCGPDGVATMCTRKLCIRPVYRKRE